MVVVWQMHFCSLTGLRDDTPLEFRILGLLHGAVKVRSLPSKFSPACGFETEREGSESSNFACYMCYMHVTSKIHATRAA